MASPPNDNLFIGLSYLNGEPEWLYVSYNSIYDPFYVHPPPIPNNGFSKFEISFNGNTFIAKIDGQTIGTFTADSDHTFVDVQDIALGGGSNPFQVRNMFLINDTDG